jgi:hypothetical protein
VRLWPLADTMTVMQLYEMVKPLRCSSVSIDFDGKTVAGRVLCDDSVAATSILQTWNGSTGVLSERRPLPLCAAIIHT